MTTGRASFGPVRLAWMDAARVADLPVGVLAPFGPQQVRRFEALSGVAAQRFLVGRRLLARLVADLSGADDPADGGFTTTCERCGAPHGRPRFERAEVEVSVSYAGSVVAVAASRRADAAAVGIDIEDLTRGRSGSALTELAPLFAPAPPPDLEGWTLLEAALKADGRGVTVDLAHVRVGDPGSGRVPGSRAVRVPGRTDGIDAAVVAGPEGFVLSAAMSSAPARVPRGASGSLQG